MTDYQNDYRNMYEELRTTIRLYFEIKHDDGTIYGEEDWEIALDETELDLMIMVGLIDEEELYDEDASDHP